MKYSIFLVVVLWCWQSQAQLVGSIQTGRPGQAIGGGVVGAGVSQIQTGIDLQTFDQNLVKTTNRTLNNIFRLGLTDRFEISSVVDYSQDTVETNTLSQDFSGISQFQLGFRYNLIPAADDWLPTLGLQTRFRLKNVSNHYQRDELAPIFVLSAVKPIDDQWTLTGNYGIAYDGISPSPTYNWVLSVSKSLTENWGTVGEIYGSQAGDQGATFYGAGLAYLVNSNLQLDTYLSAGENRGIRMFYGTLGVSWRTLAFFKTRKIY